MSDKLTDADLEWARKIAEHMPTDPRTLLADPAHWTALLANTLAEYRQSLETAAEERGRRRGVEERDELLRKLLAWADSSPVKAVTVSAWIHGVKFKPEDVAVWDEVRAALAPRDSAPDPVTPYQVPRDSGKEDL